MTKTNEIERLVIEFASTVGDRRMWPIDKTSQYWLVCEQTDDQAPVWRLMSDSICQPYSLIGGICQKEAIQAEFGERLCNGKRVKAEGYLELWREAMSNGIALSALAARGMAIDCAFTNSTEYLLGFGEEEYKERAAAALNTPYLTSRNDTQSSWLMRMDSIEACEAWYAVERLRPYSDKYKDLYSASTTLRILEAGQPSAAKPAFDLFSEVAVAA